MKKIFFSLVLVLVILSGCKKEKDPCNAGYTGANCDQEIAPSKITITKISVLGFEPLNNGQYWDLNNGLADLQIVLNTEGGPELYQSDVTVNCDPNAQYDFVPDSSIQVYYLNSPLLTIKVWDQDVSSVTVIDEITFSPYQSNAGFPSVIHLVDGYTKIDISVSYTW